jgi:rhodanese-related sulfurtransferase
MTVATISPAGLASRQRERKNLDLIDVRTPIEFREVHVAFARNVPLDQLNPKEIWDQRKDSSDEPLYVICKAGGRGRQAAEKFKQAGFENVVNVEGGTTAAEQAGMALVRGAKVMSLERQVRIVAGSLILIGVVLGFTVHPYLFGLAGFVGAGLVFAGVTDTCGMGLLLARMPWNQCSAGK